jgi:hypothetical protein
MPWEAVVNGELCGLIANQHEAGVEPTLHRVIWAVDARRGELGGRHQRLLAEVLQSSQSALAAPGLGD